MFDSILMCLSDYLKILSTIPLFSHTFFWYIHFSRTWDKRQNVLSEMRKILAFYIFFCSFIFLRQALTSAWHNKYTPFNVLISHY